MKKAWNSVSETGLRTVHPTDLHTYTEVSSLGKIPKSCEL